MTFACAVMLAILLFGNLSGAHINPAVSIAFWREGELENGQLLLYIAGQMAGGLVAAIALGGAGPTVVASDLTLIEAFAIEVSITMLLMLASLLFYGTSTVLGAWFACDIKRLAFPEKRTQD